MKHRIYTTGDVAKMFRKSVRTIQQWDRDGLFTAKRTVTGRRFYTKDQIDNFLGISSCKELRSIAYCRVSSQAQKPDLKNQRSVIEEFCVSKCLANVEYVEEIGGGLNFKRKKFLQLIDWICNRELSEIIIAHQDRLVRFGFDLLKYLCEQNNVKITVINIEKLSPEQEMVQDLMTIVHCFSSRLYGLRNYRKALKAALKK